MNNRKWWVGLGLLVMMIVVFSGCSKKEDAVLRIAMGSPGEAMVKVWEDVKEIYEDEYPDITVELNIIDDDLYQTIGLPNLLSGSNAPDIYFEWAGERMRIREADGFAADLTEAITQEGLKERFTKNDFKDMDVDGKTYMIPSTSDVTNVMWYNKKIFSDLNLTPPASWEEFIAVSEEIKDAGIIPISTGNKDLWPAGNWIAHLLSRSVGEEAYNEAFLMKKPFNTPDFVRALGLLKELHDKELINESANAISDNEGAVLFFNGKAAMHPIGSWLVSWAIEEAPDLDFDFFNLPALSDGKGDQTSVIGVATGHMINKNTKIFQESVNFLKIYSSPQVTKMLVEAGMTPMTTNAFEGVEVAEQTDKLNDMMKSTATLVSPPDVGYDLELASLFNAAVSQVMGGVKSPEEALQELDDKAALINQ